MFSLLRTQRFRAALVITALILSALSLIYSHTLTHRLYEEEVGKMEVWAEAMQSLTTADETTDLSLVLKVINSNNTIPVVVTDAYGNILAQRNLRPNPQGKDSLQTLQREAERIRRKGETMKVAITSTPSNDEADYLNVSYEESVLLRQLTFYPYLQLGIVGVFFFIAIIALLASKRAEQNKVWVGLSRETAHQLGTPISSLMAWSEVLSETYPDDELLPEMNKDVKRLQLIAERFSKIGSAPELKPQDVRPIVARIAEYFERRTSQRVSITVDLPAEAVTAQVNAPLFEWVIENLCKNAIDAMQGVGSLHLSLRANALQRKKRRYLQILVTDTGKGIAHNRFKTVFKPGFTTKKRGWGLGLSLAKRIVEEYHHGRIYVLNSQVGKGTTFAIELEESAL